MVKKVFQLWTVVDKCIHVCVWCVCVCVSGVCVWCVCVSGVCLVCVCVWCVCVCVDKCIRVCVLCVCVLCVCVCCVCLSVCLSGKYFFFFGPSCATCGILVPRPGMEPLPPALGAQSLKHWTAREIPGQYLWCFKPLRLAKEIFCFVFELLCGRVSFFK